MPIEEQVAAHYSRSGLSEAILSALAASGKDIDNRAGSVIAGRCTPYNRHRSATKPGRAHCE